jgi:PHD/YefM family antitoxin component YafN of YafNO toxin-antitoxin module
MQGKRNPAPLSNVVPALVARTQFGRILGQVERERRSFVVEKRGSPKAIILSVADYIKLAAPEPEILRIVGEESKRKGTDRLSMRQIDSVIREARRQRRAKHAGAQPRS